MRGPIISSIIAKGKEGEATLSFIDQGGGRGGGGLLA